MQIGLIGLGRMGAGMAQRLLRAQHAIVGFDMSRAQVEQIVETGAAGARSLQDLASQLAPPRTVWVMVPHGAAKQPGPDLAMRTVTMNFRYAEAFGVEEPPRAYAWLLLDVMQGDQTLFARADWIDKAWQIVDPIVERWASERPKDVPNYAAGSAGPAAADHVTQRDGRQWRLL